MKPRGLMRAVLEQYVLAPDGIHGVSHWARVCAAGRHLAEAAAVDPDFAELFALLHDACRWNDGSDPEHGARAAALAIALRGQHFELPDAAFAELQRALTFHSDGRVEDVPAVQVCWDADRLDLTRIGVRPWPRLLCTPAARALAAGEGQLPAFDSTAFLAARWGVTPRGSLLDAHPEDHP
ncbi:MAG: hypothetical protein R3C71_10745 [Candidatus Krumholzibacteriia bacterium]|nr:hypothetical protein [Candidatus Latescibacterota bacterium]